MTWVSFRCCFDSCLLGQPNSKWANAFQEAYTKAPRGLLDGGPMMVRRLLQCKVRWIVVASLTWNPGEDDGEESCCYVRHFENRDIAIQNILIWLSQLHVFWTCGRSQYLLPWQRPPPPRFRLLQIRWCILWRGLSFHEMTANLYLLLLYH